MPGTLISVEMKTLDTQLLENLAGFDTLATQHYGAAMAATVAIGKNKLRSEIVLIADQNRAAMAGEVGGDFTPLAPVNARMGQEKMFGIYEIHGPIDIVGVLGNTSGKYFALANAGRGPGGHPPAARMEKWAEANLGVTPAPDRVAKRGKKAGQVIKDVSVGRALSHAIAQKGVKGNFDLKAIADGLQQVVNDKFEAALKKIAEELGFK